MIWTLFGIGMYGSGLLIGMRLGQYFWGCRHTQAITITSSSRTVTAYLKEGDYL